MTNNGNKRKLSLLTVFKLFQGFLLIQTVSTMNSLCLHASNYRTVMINWWKAEIPWTTACGSKRAKWESRENIHTSTDDVRCRSTFWREAIRHHFWAILSTNFRTSQTIGGTVNVEFSWILCILDSLTVCTRIFHTKYSTHISPDKFQCPHQMNT